LGGTPLGEVEEAFASSLTPGDTFLIGGQVVRYEGLNEMTVEVTRTPGRDPKVAVFSGTKFATSTLLTDRILEIFQQPDWPALPRHTADWLLMQRDLSRLPKPGRLLIETFPYESRHHLCVYGFAGRNAQQTLGLLLTKRMEDQGLAPLGFVATDYATLIWGLEPVTDPAALLNRDTLRHDLETWLAGNAVMKRTFRNTAIIAGLIERTHQGRRKSGRQATFSSDILYETLRKYDPNHLMLAITRTEAMRGLVDFQRLDDMLAQIGPHIDHVKLARPSPLAAPLFLEPGKVPVDGKGREKLAESAAAQLMRDAGLA
jgi:ATP-dependent Lhr-like helicase